MKWIFITSMVLFLVSCNDAEQPAATESALVLDKPASLSAYQVEAIEGSDLQIATRLDPSGKLVEKGFVKDGKRTGAWMTYFDDENALRLKSLMTYVDDQYNGVYMEFSDRGQLKLIAHYVNNQLNGTMAKYEFGRILEQSEYKNGKLDGVYKKFYGNKKLQTEAAYKNGKQDGFYHYYDEKGRLIMDYEYKDGEKVKGEFISPDE